MKKASNPCTLLKTVRSGIKAFLQVVTEDTALNL
jgi:hypothetical protein